MSWGQTPLTLCAMAKLVGDAEGGADDVTTETETRMRGARVEVEGIGTRGID